MAKKRKASGPATDISEGFEPRGGKLGPITSYEDIADSEDEFHINRDKVLLDEGPDTKRRRKWQEQDAFLDHSDEEILGYSTESEDEDEIEDYETTQKVSKNDSPADEASEHEEDEDVGGWGSSRKDYYNNDQIATEADALEEEAEARRLQQKKLQKMSEADFGLDEIEWLGADNKEEDGEGGVVTEVLKDVEITPDMEPEERSRIFQARYPEFQFIAEEYRNLHPIFEDLKHQVESESPQKGSPKSVEGIKHSALGAYMACMAMYFAILTSPARDKGEARCLDPAELHDHVVMDTLLKCRETWSKVKSLKPRAPKPVHVDSESEPKKRIEAQQIDAGDDARPSKKTRKERARLAAAEEIAAIRAQKIEDAEEELADLSNLIPKSRKASKKSKAVVITDDDSDFGEEETMDAKSAAEKEQKKKSLRFYTSQITQKANKRAGAGRDAGGDADLPHRERLRDRQARLNAEAEKRGKKLDEYGRGGVELGGGSDSGEDAVAKQVRDDENDYYDLVAKASEKKKEIKQQKMEAIKQAKAEGGLVRIVEGEVDEDGKRAIGYVIEKNKGLAPKRKKDVRNPRVKKRKKYEEKKKKLASTRAVYKGGEERGGYGGEKTGIKPGLVKSIKL